MFKNLAISFMSAWIFYGLCEVKKVIIAACVFFVVLELLTVLDHIFKALKECANE